MNTKTILYVVTTVSVALLLGGCDEGKGNTAAGSGSAKSSATGAATATATKKSEAKPAGDDMKAICEKMCDKGVECSVEVAKASDVPEEFVKTAKADSEKALPECKKDCGTDTDKVTDKEKAQLPKVMACLSKPCSEFAKCIDSIIE